MKAQEIMEKYQITRNTLCNWVKAGDIKIEKTPSGRYIYHDKSSELISSKRKNIIYARVSTSAQKDNLVRQIDKLKSYCSSQGILVDDVYEEVASALNYNRVKYQKLLKEICSNQIETIIIEYKDRLLRIGFEELELICNIFNVKIIVLDNSERKDSKQEITEDLISIIHHYSMKIYSSRKRKKLEDYIKDDNS